MGHFPLNRSDIYTDEPVNMSRLVSGRFCGIPAVCICSFDALHKPAIALIDQSTVCTILPRQRTMADEQLLDGANGDGAANTTDLE